MQQRSSGIVLHPTSLPSQHGIGDLGPTAHAFIDFLRSGRQGLWQVLPLGPTGFGDSPYQTLSAFAGNPLLLSPALLQRDGWLHAHEGHPPPDLSAHCVDFERAGQWKEHVLTCASTRFAREANSVAKGAFDDFCQRHQHWLDDYALFSALKAHFGGGSWLDWPQDLRERHPKVLQHWRGALAEAITHHRFVQWQFDHQWQQLRTRAHKAGVRLIGDIPIFVAHDSADVWANPSLFKLNPRSGQPQVVAGVPPDYFSETGQRWGNPLYDWAALRKVDYSFWVERMRHLLHHVDQVRIDHFRGFAAHWEIPAAEPTAINGEWVEGPGRDLFDSLRRQLGDMPLIAEDLGLITDDVIALRDTLELPGMAVLQFAFEPADENGFGETAYLPHHHGQRQVVYTGTHDNNTTLGWWSEQPELVRHFVRRYMNTDGLAIQWDFIRTAMSSVADTALFPLQDVLGLGSEACLNRPGQAEGNWNWRFREGALDAALAERLWELSELFGRSPAEVSQGKRYADLNQ